MSFIRLTLQTLGNASRTGLQRVITARSFSQSFARSNEKQEQVETEEQPEGNGEEGELEEKLHPLVDRTKVIPVETSIKYLQSDAYKQTYGNDPVWKPYRRNFKGQFAPKKTKKTCIRAGILSTSNPCPICRDEYLVLDYRNTSLLNQFISPYNGETLSYEKTGVCQYKHKMLLAAILKAKDYGTISYDVPFRTYDYSEWRPASSPESETKEEKK